MEYATKKLKQEAEESRQRKRKPSATQTKEEAERAEGDDRHEDEDYVPSEEPSSEDPPYEPTKKELKRADKATSKLYFVRNVFFPCTTRLTQYSYFFLDFNPFSYSTDRLFFSTIESSY